MEVYFNNVLQRSYTRSEPLVEALPTTKIIINSPPKDAGSYIMTDLTISNGLPDPPGIKINNGWKLLQSDNTQYNLTWADTGLLSNSYMKISFNITINKTKYDFIELIHFTNTGRMCCNSGDRIPAIILYSGNTRLLLSSSTTANPDDDITTNLIPLNTKTFVSIFYKGQLMEVYFNDILQKSYTRSAPLIKPLPTTKIIINSPPDGTSTYTMTDLVITNIAQPVNNSTTKLNKENFDLLYNNNNLENYSLISHNNNISIYLGIFIILLILLFIYFMCSSKNIKNKSKKIILKK
jgi:hypothetical protein